MKQGKILTMKSTRGGINLQEIATALKKMNEVPGLEELIKDVIRAAEAIGMYW